MIMSLDAIEIARRAEHAVLPLLSELFESGVESNRIGLGALYSGDQYLQVQLVITANPAELLDDDLLMDDES
jgi:hypothetical protein